MLLSKLWSDASLKTFIKGSFWIVYGNVLSKGASLLASVLIARLLSSSAFGELSMIKTTLSVFSLFATFGLGVTVTKFVAESRSNQVSEVGSIISGALFITMVTGVTLGALIAIFAGFIGENILHAANLSTPLRVAGVFLLLNAVNVSQTGIITGLEGFRKSARINLVIAIITIPVLLGFTCLLGLTGTLIGMTVNLFVNWYLNRLLILRMLKELGAHLSYQNIKARIRTLVIFSFPLAIKEIIYSFSTWLCLYILMRKASYSEVGVFSSANQLSQLIFFLPAAVSSVFLSVLSNQLNNKENYRNLIRKNLWFTVSVTVGVGVALLLFSGPIFAFYGSSYSGGREALYVLTAATVPMAIINILEQICIARSRPVLVTVFQMVIQGLVLSTAILLLQYNQTATSLSLAYAIGNSIAAIAMAIYLHREGLFH